MKISAYIVASAAVLALAGAPARAADAAKEVATAAAHAGMAAASDSTKMVQAHLHHVVNCLEGPSGADFDAAAANPCKDLGAGAISDSAPDKRALLQSAAEKAKKAIADPDMTKAKATASDIQASLSK